MIIYLIRHGQTTGDLEDRFGGDYDDHLTRKGVEQAKELAKKLSDKSIEIIYSSPRKRAVETADIFAKEMHVRLMAVDDIRERNRYGILTGMTRIEAARKYPDEFVKLKVKTYSCPKGAEEYSTFKDSVLKGFDNIFSSDHRIIAVVSHGGPIGCLVRETLKLGEFEKLGDCAYLKLEKINKKLNLLEMHNAVLKEY